MQDTRCKIQTTGLENQGSRIMDRASAIQNQRGIALAMVLILSAIILAIIAGLIYMITATTQVSGMQKRYKTALEAGVGGSEVTFQFIALRGEATDTAYLQSLLASLSPVITTPNACTGRDISGDTFTGLAAKLMTPTTSWSEGCNSTLSIIPNATASYDLSYELGASPYPTYKVYAKFVDAVEGNSAPDKGLGGTGVVVSGSGDVAVMSMPYLYTIEVDSQNKDNPAERAKLSILYQY